MRQIIDGVYMTVEAECDGCSDHLLVWVTSHVKGTSGMEWWPRGAKRPDGLDVLQKKGDEAYMLIFLEPDGRQGVVLWPVDPTWTKERLWESIEARKQGILDGSIAREPEVAT